MGIKDVWARRLISEFPSRNWSRRGLQDFLHRLREPAQLSTHLAADGRPRMIQTDENVAAVQEMTPLISCKVVC